MTNDCVASVIEISRLYRVKVRKFGVDKKDAILFTVGITNSLCLYVSNIIIECNKLSSYH